MVISNKKLQRGANWATIAAGVSAVLTLWIGLYIFWQTNNAQADATAVELMQNYFKMKLDHKELADRPPEAPVDQDYIKFAAHNMLIAETIYKLNAGDAGWEGTVIDIVNDHKPFIYHPSFPCDQYHPRFRIFIQNRIDKDLCARK